MFVYEIRVCDVPIHFKMNQVNENKYLTTRFFTKCIIKMCMKYLFKLILTHIVLNKVTEICDILRGNNTCV